MTAVPEDVIHTVLNSSVVLAIITIIGQTVLSLINKTTKSGTTSNTVHNAVDSTIFNDVPEIQQIIDRLLNKTSISGVHFIKTENGGGRPRLGTNIYLSISYEAVKDSLYLSKVDYQKMLIDEPYIRILNNIGTTQPLVISVGDMEEGMLKRIFDNVGIKYVEMYFIGETDTAFFYVSLSTVDEGYEFNEIVDRVEIEIAINKLRNLFAKLVADNS